MNRTFTLQKGAQLYKYNFGWGFLSATKLVRDLVFNSGNVKK